MKQLLTIVISAMTFGVFAGQENVPVTFDTSSVPVGTEVNVEANGEVFATTRTTGPKLFALLPDGASSYGLMKTSGTSDSIKTDFTTCTALPEGWTVKSYRNATPFNFGTNGAVVPGWNQSQIATSYTIKNTDEVIIDVVTYANGNQNNNLVMFLASSTYSVEIGNSYDKDLNLRIGAYSGDASTKFASFQANAAFAVPESSKVIADSKAITLGGPLTYHLELSGTSLTGTVTDGTVDPIEFEFTLPETYTFTTFGVSVDAAANAAGVKSVSITGGSIAQPLTVAEDTTMTPEEINAYPSVTINDGVTLTINTESNATLAKAIGGAGKLAKIGTGTLTLSSDNAFTGGTTISAGTIALGSSYALGAAGSAVTVCEGATLDVNGKQDYLLAITLDGGTLMNGGSNIGTDKAQIKSLTLTKDSTVVANGNFGIVNSGHKATTLTLNEHKLTKQGTAEFWLVTVTSDAGTIQIDAGAIHVDRYASTLEGVAFAAPTTADMIIQNATVVNPAPAGTVYQQVERQGGETIYITTGVGSYVLAAGNAATLKDGDVIAFDAHYKGEKWGSAPSFVNFAGHKVVVDIEMNINGGIQANQEVEINAQDYIRGGIGNGASIEGAGSVYVGYSTSDMIHTSTISTAKFGFQDNANTYTAVIDGTVFVGATTQILEGGDDDHFQLIEGGVLVVPTKLSDGKVVSGVDGFKVDISEKTLVTYSLVADTPAMPTEIAGGSTEQQTAYTEWAEGKVTDHTATGVAEAFALNLTATELADKTFEEAVQDKLDTLITADMVAELAAKAAEDETSVTIEGFENATFTFVPVEEIETSAKLFRLSVEFNAKGQN